MVEKETNNITPVKGEIIAFFKLRLIYGLQPELYAKKFMFFVTELNSINSISFSGFKVREKLVFIHNK
jgi:hypothetical protein